MCRFTYSFMYLYLRQSSTVLLHCSTQGYLFIPVNRRDQLAFSVQYSLLFIIAFLKSHMAKMDITSCLCSMQKILWVNCGPFTYTCAEEGQFGL